MKRRFLLSISFVWVIGLLTSCGEKEDKDILAARSAIANENYTAAQSSTQTALSRKPNHPEAQSLQQIFQLRAPSGEGWKTEPTNWHGAIQKILDYLQPLKAEIKTYKALDDPDSDDLDRLEWLVRSRHSITGTLAASFAEAVEQNPNLLSALINQTDPVVITALLDAENCFNLEPRQVAAGLIQQLGDEASVYNLLVNEIQNSDAAIRKQAVKHLGNLRDPKLIPELESILKNKSESPDVLYEAILVLEPLIDQNDHPILPALKLATRTNAAQVRMHAAKLLGLLKVENAIGDLIRLLADSNEHVKNSAIKALTRIGKPSIHPLIAVLDSDAKNVIPDENPGFKNEYQYIANVYIDVDRLKKRRISTQAAAIQTLGALKAKEAIPRLIDLFENDELHKSAAAALTAMQAVATLDLTQALQYPLFSIGIALQSDLDNGLISENLKHELENNGISLSQSAAVSIEKEGGKWMITDRARNKKQIYVLRKDADKLNISRDNLRIRTVEVLNSISDPRAVDALSQTLMNDPSREVKAAAAQALSTIKIPGTKNIAVDALTQALDLDDTTTANAATALGGIRISTDQAVQKLIALALDKRGRETVRIAALLGLSQLKPAEAIQPMLMMMLSDETSAVLRKGAVTVLGEIQATEAMPALLFVLSTRYENVKKFQRHMKRKYKALATLNAAIDALGIQWTPAYPRPDYKKWGELKPIPGLVRGEAAIALGKVKGELLFSSTGLEKYKPDLKKGNILAGLQQEFKNHGITLSQSVTTDRVDEIWFLTNKENGERYHLRKVEGLNIYAKGDEVLETLLEALKRDERAAVRRSVALTLEALKGDSVIPPLVRALRKDKQGVVRQEAAISLGKITGDQVVNPLVTSLKKDKYEATRKQAAIALRALKPELADGGMVDVLKKSVGTFEERHEVESVMKEVIVSLVKDGTEATLKFLVDGLKSVDKDDEWARWAILHTIGEINKASDKVKMTASQRQPMLDAIVRELTHPSYLVRKEAVAALGKTKDREFVDVFIKVLQNTNEAKSVRATAATALGTMLDESASAPLLAALDDPKAEVRQQAAVALGAIKDAKAVDKLIGFLRNPLEDDAVKKDCVTALGAIGDKEAEDALLTILRTETGDVFTNAITALGTLKSRAAVPELIAILADQNLETYAIPEETAKPAADTTAAEAAAKLSVRAKAAEALAKIEDARAADAIGRRLVDESEYVVSVKDKFNHNWVWELFVKATKPFQLPDFVAPKMVERIEQSQPEDWPIKVASANALGKCNTPEAIAKLRELLTDVRIEVRQAAALGIGEGKHSELKDEVVKIVTGETETNIDVRRGAAQGLGEYGDPSAVPGLIEVFNNDAVDEALRRDAAIALGKIGTDGAVSPLIEKLQALPSDQSTKNLRLDIVKGLGESKNQKAVSILETALEDADADIHFWAADALFQITGEGYGYHRVNLM